MTARAAVHSLIQGDSVITQDLGVGGVYAAESVDTPPEELVIVIRWLETEKAFGTTGPTPLQIWVHDTQRDYGRITDVLKRLKDLLPATIHLPGEDGWTLSTAEWRGESRDLYDDGYKTVTRYAEFSAVSRYTAS
jgi:hypothetical protein